MCKAMEAGYYLAVCAVEKKKTEKYFTIYVLFFFKGEKIFFHVFLLVEG